jgi:TonB family protein
MVTAQEPGHDLDDLAKRVSKQISKAGISAVVVADFVNLDGTTSMQGQYLAEEFSQRLEHHKKNFALVDRKKLSSALSNAHLSVNDLAAADSLQRIGLSLPADAIVTGTLETTPGQYSVRVTVRKARDSSLISSGDQAIRRPAYVDLLDPGRPVAKIAKAGVDRVGVPTCVHCPPPNYTDKARAAKIQGNVVLRVVINEEGHADRISVIRATDEGLAIKAIEAVRKWQFKPATDKRGKAVAVIVPIEVTFRLY